VEAIILAGGKAERLGDAAGGRPKALVEVAGKPLAAYQVGRLAQAGVSRVIFACAAGAGRCSRTSWPGSALRSSRRRSPSGSAGRRHPLRGAVAP
jgi:Predicted sugar nucleotidyltransferases